MRIGRWNINLNISRVQDIEDYCQPSILRKRDELYFYCNNCERWVKMNPLEDGRTLIDWMKQENVETEALTLEHNTCGFKIKIATAKEVAVKIVEDSYGQYED